MKICWDNLIGLRLTKFGNFHKGTKTYIYREKCSCCGEPCLMRKDSPGLFCSNSCSSYGDNNVMRNHAVAKRNKANSKGQVRSRKIPLYNTYADKLSCAERIRSAHTSDNVKVVEVRCSKCGRWFRPTDGQVWNRVACLNGDRPGESKFYCSDRCKSACEVYWRSVYPRRSKSLYDLSIWRKEVLDREENECEYCGDCATDAHHIKPIKLEPFFALDPDNGVACCEKCHYLYGHRDECSTGRLASVICK